MTERETGTVKWIDTKKGYGFFKCGGKRQFLEEFQYHRGI